MTNTAINLTAATIGGAGQNISLNFDGKDLATYYATALASSLALNGVIIEPVTYPDGPSIGAVPYLVIPISYSGSSVVAGSGYDAIVIGSTTHAVTLTGGGVTGPGGQVIIASDSGLDLKVSDATNEAIFAGGGNNDIDLRGSSGEDFVYLSSGSNTIYAGSGATSIDAGTGSNSIFAGSGGTRIAVEGRDSIQLAGGVSSIYVGAFYGEPDGASALVYGETSPTIASTIYFEGDGINASTVFGGSSGSDTFIAGAGGGVFTGGTGGGNIFIGGVNSGAGSDTFTAAGNLNYLQGSSGGGDQLNGGDATNVVIVTESTETKGDVVNTGSGNDTVDLLGGQDTVNIGSGTATVNVATGTSVNGGFGSLYFIGGTTASTVIGGAGAETVFGNSGGGYFTAGPNGGNVLIGGSGAATFVGGGSGDYLEGDDQAGGTADLLKAGSGNETLVAGSGADTLSGSTTGSDVFSFVHETAGQSYTINSFYVGPTSGDALYFLNAADEAYALSHYSVTNGSGVITLADGTKITLEGYTGSISGHTGSA